MSDLMIVFFQNIFSTIFSFEKCKTHVVNDFKITGKVLCISSVVIFTGCTTTSKNATDSSTLPVAAFQTHEASLPISITLGSAPPKLVTRYIATYAYNGSNDTSIWGTGEYGPEGGTLFGKLYPINGQYPSTIPVSITTDFTPESGLNAVEEQFSPEITDVGLAYIYEPHQKIMFRDLYLRILPRFFLYEMFLSQRDFLVVRWVQTIQGKEITSTTTITKDQLRRRPLLELTFPLNPNPDLPGVFKLELSGYYSGQDVEPYIENIPYSESAVVLQMVRDRKQKRIFFTKYPNSKI